MTDFTDTFYNLIGADHRKYFIREVGLKEKNLDLLNFDISYINSRVTLTFKNITFFIEDTFDQVAYIVAILRSSTIGYKLSQILKREIDLNIPFTVIFDHCANEQKQSIKIDANRYFFEFNHIHFNNCIFETVTIKTELTTRITGGIDFEKIKEPNRGLNFNNTVIQELIVEKFDGEIKNLEIIILDDRTDNKTIYSNCKIKFIKSLGNKIGYPEICQKYNKISIVKLSNDDVKNNELSTYLDDFKFSIEHLLKNNNFKNNTESRNNLRYNYNLIESKSSLLRNCLFKIHKWYTILWPSLIIFTLSWIFLTLILEEFQFGTNSQTHIFFPPEFFKNVIFKDFSFANDLSLFKCFSLIVYLLFTYSIYSIAKIFKLRYGFKIEQSRNL